MKHLGSRSEPQLFVRTVICWRPARSPLQSRQGTGMFFHQWRQRARIATLLGMSHRQFTGLLQTVTARACVAARLAADRGLMASNQAGDLRDVVLGFHKSGNLVSFNLTEVFVIHRQLRLAGQDALNAKHPQPPSCGQSALSFCFIDESLRYF